MVSKYASHFTTLCMIGKINYTYQFYHIHLSLYICSVVYHLSHYVMFHLMLYHVISLCYVVIFCILYVMPCHIILLFIVKLLYAVFCVVLLLLLLFCHVAFLSFALPITYYSVNCIPSIYHVIHSVLSRVSNIEGTNVYSVLKFIHLFI